MDVETIRSFLAVAKHRSISKAAASLYVTQPAMSQRLRRFEESLGFALLERDWRGVSLTTEGAYFLPYAAQLLRELSNASQVLGKQKMPKPRSFTEVVDHPRKVLLGVDSWLSEQSVRSVVQTALTRYTLDDLQIITRPATTIIDLLELNQLDAALFYSPDQDYPFHTEIVDTEQTVLIHPEGTSLGEHSQPSLKALLADYRFILFDNPVLTHHAAITTAMIDSLSITQFHIVDDYRTMLSLIRLGGCVSMVPAGTVMAQQALGAQDLTFTPLTGILPGINIAVGMSDAGRAKDLEEYFPQQVSKFMQESPS
ncbi:hypothetical protein BLJ79_17695 [Arthrobacter sp. UCD-GKA]|uniref:LysR family transcriptional regulator n=1 Tax=Arthrobacter sp. UCD-GKA TaxID=1913576 RepID=UPI0008DCA5D7|nr:LysR family transcriptional regulator [Arthrobacter sp. UCD-GKA]OIH82789.1 hypothetical protein BLJ79_17695 [Arthrobacter sp. UCD-GKA]